MPAAGTSVLSNIFFFIFIRELRTIVYLHVRVFVESPGTTRPRLNAGRTGLRGPTTTLLVTAADNYYFTINDGDKIAACFHYLSVHTHARLQCTYRIAVRDETVDIIPLAPPIRYEFEFSLFFSFEPLLDTYNLHKKKKNRLISVLEEYNIYRLDWARRGNHPAARLNGVRVISGRGSNFALIF